MYAPVVAVSLKSKLIHASVSFCVQTQGLNVQTFTKPPHNFYSTRADPPDSRPCVAHLSEHANR